MLFKFLEINSFEYNSIGNSFPSWKTTTIILNNSDNITRIVFLIFLSSERNYNAMLKIVENLMIVTFDEFF